MRRAVAALALACACAAGTACGSGTAAVPIERGAPCAFCRMAIVDEHLAAEIVAPGEEPRQYDDIGCLANDLQKRAIPSGGRAFVADYRSGALLPAESAIYSRVEALATPMMSHLFAHPNDAARLADARVREGVRMTPREVFGSTLPGGSDGR